LPESLRDERREKVVCHQHRAGDIMTETNESTERSCIHHEEQRTENRALGNAIQTDTVRCVRKRSSHYILHKRCEMKGKT